MNAASAVAIDDRLAGHGGRLCVARALHPQAPQPWIDLSTGINPKPYPAPRASSSSRARLPEPQELRALEEVAARAFGVAEQDCVVAVGGSEAALRLMPYVLQVDRAAIVGPTYSSHEDAWRKAGSCVDVVERTHGLLIPSSPHPNPPPLRRGGSQLIDIPLNSQPRPFPCEAGEGQDGGAGFNHPHPRCAWMHEWRERRDAQERPPLRQGAGRQVITVVNPNNPDGAVLHRDRLLALHDQLAQHDGYLVVDEAFADAAPACSVASLAGSKRYPRLLVLRSFGKFYGLAGLRLGFVIAAPGIAQRFRSLLGDWPVTADAIAAGCAAYADAAWGERTRARLQSAAHSLDALLVRSGFTLVGGTSLFRLARSNTAGRCFERLLDAGILVRPFDHDATLLRFGLPYGAPAWQRLTRALGAEA